MLIRHVFLATIALAPIGAFALVACSSSQSSTGTTTTSTGTVTVHVSAAAGGTVASPGGKASLAIPAGALAEDTDIKLDVSAAANGSAGDVLDFGPDGLKFLKPATLTIKADGVTVPDGKSVSVAILEGSTWKALEGATFANGVATASVMHFTKYSIILVDGKAILQPPSTCTDARAGFTPCGGDPTGTWKFADFCIDPKTLGNDPFQGKCTQFVSTVEYTSNGTVTITGTATSGSETSAPSTSNLTFVSTFPLTCAQGDGGLNVSDCTKLSGSKPGDPQCVDTGGGNCKCTASSTKDSTGGTRTYTTSGNVYTSTDGKSTSSGEYCVKNNLLYYREIKDGGEGLLYVLNRQ